MPSTDKYCEEIWAPVPGYAGLYEVSSFGRVRSLARKTFKGKRGGKLMRLQGRANGYPSVVLSRAPNTRRDRLSIHRLVLEAFVGPCPPGMEACHYPDPDKTNCRLENLRWDTRLNNLADDAVLNRRRTKLTRDAVVSIKRQSAQGVQQQQLAIKFGISQSAVSAILRGRIWRHIQAEESHV